MRLQAGSSLKRRFSAVGGWRIVSAPRDGTALGGLGLKCWGLVLAPQSLAPRAESLPTSRLTWLHVLVRSSLPSASQSPSPLTHSIPALASLNYIPSSFLLRGPVLIQGHHQLMAGFLDSLFIILPPSNLVPLSSILTLLLSSSFWNACQSGPLSFSRKRLNCFTCSARLFRTRSLELLGFGPISMIISFPHPLFGLYFVTGFQNNSLLCLISEGF